MKLLLIIVFILSNAFAKNSLSGPIVNSEVNNIDISDDAELEMETSGSEIISFTILNENYFYCFSSDTENVFYKDNEGIYDLVPNDSFFKNGDIIYVNPEGLTHDKMIIKVTPYPIYGELNSFETISENQYFFLKANEDSIAYFDSFDRNSSIYISETFNKTILKNDTRINGIFYPINASVTYMIKNRLNYKSSISNFKKYLYPMDLTTKEQIDIKDNEISFIYLQKKGSYTLYFKESSMKTMMKLSTKTPKAKVSILKEGETITLTSQNPYFEIDSIAETLELNVEEADAFIEFLYNFGDADILTDENKTDYKSEKNTIIIIIPKTQKDFELNLVSKNTIDFSLSFGLSNTNNYYYSSSSNEIMDTKSKSISLIYSPYKNIESLNDEFITLAINFKENHEVMISYRQFSEIDELLDEEMDPQACKDILSNISEVLDIYVFQDIAQNPPDIKDHPGYHHKRINLKEEIEKISPNNRKFYEFYQEVEKILTATKDLHFNIDVDYTMKGTEFYSYYAYLPFNFEIREDNREQKIFIKKNRLFEQFDKETKEFIDSHLNIPLKTINNIDTFDYIQNWSKYSSCKNVHSQFTFIIYRVPGFYLGSFPVDYFDLKNDYEFEDNEIMRIPYKIEKPEPLLQTAEFRDYFANIMKKHLYSPIVPSIHEIKDKFLISKGLKSEIKIEQEKNGQIDWNITYDEDSATIRCRVDNEKGVNVLYQNTFYMNLEKFMGTIFECVKLFHSNNYPLIIIESMNSGGYGNLPVVMHQLMNMRTTNRIYNSYRITNTSKEYLEYYHGFYYTNMETCELVDSLDKLNIKTDYYDYNDLNITHQRTDVMDMVYIPFRKALDQFRKEYEKSSNIKNSTDIIIFTDAFSYSATSVLIKSFQRTGAAILVGYCGNPKKKGTFEFDASQAFSSVVDLEGTKTKENLKRYGFIINGVTVSETYDEFYQAKNPIPFEYDFNPVDERVEIYSSYSDNLYKKFIDEGLEIHNKYKEKCNPNNTRLFKHDDNCVIEDLEHAHGGHRCTEDGTWSTKCEPYYCDIGYYFDRFHGSCIKECDIENAHSTFLYEKDYSKDIQINQNEVYYFITTPKDDIYYIFEASDNNLIEYYPRISAIDYYNDEITVNNDKKLSGKLKIYTIKKEENVEYGSVGNSFFNDFFSLLDLKYILIFRPLEDHIFYLNGITNKKTDRIKYAHLDKDATFKDIQSLNNKYFNNFYDELITLKKDEVYVISMNYDPKTIEQLSYHLQYIDYKEPISIIDGQSNYLYLKEGIPYKLNIIYNALTKVLKLSRLTKNSEVHIEEFNITLNSKNLYYEINQKFTGELNLIANNSDAFIEILYYIDGVQTLDFAKKEYKNLNEGLYMISIPKNIKSKFINFEINGKENVMYSFFTGYSLPNYTYIKQVEDSEHITNMKFNFEIDNPYDKGIELMDEEYYNLLLLVANEELNLAVKIDGQKDDKGLETWALALIIAGSVLFLILIIIIIVICCKKKNHISNKEIEEKMENLNELGNN